MKALPLAAGAVALCLSTAPAMGNDDADHLIKLDKRWGKAQKAEDLKPLLAEKFMGIGPEGWAERKDLIEDMKENGGPPGDYVSGDYKVRFINDHVAVMTHSAGSGKDKHLSMHVWRKHDGKWKVFATASTPAD